MWKSDKNFPSRGFFTPPPSWKSRPFRSPKMPLSEKKRSSPNSVIRSDLFHVIHKVPAGDSPYVKAKQVQLIDKDPSRAISLFWAAINAGDRVDSALKDMAIVMKQLDRSDEAIEAIKSFRHLCPYDSQESIDNVLVELYKRSGRIEEEIEMLQCKLRQIEEGTVFGGKRTKAARSQGKKVHITIEQETARVLGNLAWAYLQQNNVRVAEGYYRRALSLEPDNNKKCNLAICLIYMNRISEAKSLLQSVRASSGAKQMEESYAKSFERAVQMLDEKEPRFSFNSTEPDEDGREYYHEKEFFGAGDGDFQNGAALSSRNWSKGPNMDNLGNKKSSFPAKVKANQDGLLRGEVSYNGRTYSSPVPTRRNIEVQFTQPKNCSWGFGNGHQAKERWQNGSKRKVLSENSTTSESFRSQDDEHFDGEFVDATYEAEETGLSSNYKTKYWSAGPDANELDVPFTQPRSCSWGFNGGNRRKGEWCRDSPGGSSRRLSFENAQATDEPDLTADWKQTSGRDNETMMKVQEELKHNSVKVGSKKSWADMVEEEEEEEEEFSTERDEEDCLEDWSSDEEFNDENLNSNILHQNHSSPSNQVDELNQLKVGSLDIKDGNRDSEDAISTRNPAVRRPLYFESAENRRSLPPLRKDLTTEGSGSEQGNRGTAMAGESVSLMRRNRLQVFQEITVHQGSP